MIDSTTNKLFLTNIILLFLAFVLNAFWTDLGLTDSENVYFALLGIIIFGISVGGVFVGYKERKENKSLIGLFGNAILALLFLIAFLFIVATMNTF